MSRQLVDRFRLIARKLFVIDAIGAILSAFFLGVVLTRFEYIFGIPKSALYLLAVLPIFFAVYDLVCYFSKPELFHNCLAVLGILNILYCGLSLIVAFYHINEITNWGWIYILIEICIVFLIAIVEMRVATKLLLKNRVSTKSS